MSSTASSDIATRAPAPIMLSGIGGERRCTCEVSQVAMYLLLLERICGKADDVVRSAMSAVQLNGRRGMDTEMEKGFGWKSGIGDGIGLGSRCLKTGSRTI